MAAKKTGIILGVVAAAGVAAAAFAGAGGLIPALDRGPNLALTQASTAQIFQPPPGAPMSFADIFERVSPAVVSIDVKSDVPIGRGGGLQGIPEGLLPFAIPGQPRGRGGEDDDRPTTREAQSSGSGFFISRDGYIVTNNHVVENSKEITVVLKDKRELKAEIVGRDEATDLAVLKVTGTNFPFVNFENASKPRVGDWVITIGNPFGLGGTATAGIVSAYGRSLEDDDSSTFVDYVQIDAPINRGNSGGPTFDIHGRVIGVNSAIFSPSPTGGSVGIGFAIPADIADSVTKSLISGGRVSRGYLGAEIQTLSEDYAEAIGLPRDRKGVYIANVVPGGPAEAAGLRKDDIVTELNGRPVETSTELTRGVAGTRTGDNIRLNVIRDGRPTTVNVRSGARPTETELRADRGGAGGRGVTPRVPDRETPQAPAVLGLRLGVVDDAARRTYSLEPSTRGVIVNQVVPRSDAAEKGLQPGDIVVRVGGRVVATPEDVTAAVEDAKRQRRETVMVLVARAGRNAPVPLKVE